jgi:hypothetical protein
MNRTLYFAVSLAFASAHANEVPRSSAPPPTESSLCSHPALLEGHFDSRAPNLSIVFKPGVDPVATANALARKYHLKIGWIFTAALKGLLLNDIDLEIIPRLRCEPSIEMVSFDAPTSI